ncbi:MAG: CCA tRNA nucleotidyltransferase [Candidatus Omnitrophica bacterium]|nr:CCA tRNA nucleotidyltransferase [Candidatus Omnitrophota bacterium]
MEKKETATHIVKILRDRGFEAYWTGGSVRDSLMGQSPKDYDIATNAKPDEVKKLFPKTVPVGEKFGVLLVVLEGQNFEVATFRTEGVYSDGRRPDSVTFSNAKEDALRRDFTINGLFYDPLSGKLLDYVEGEKDIQAKRIRTIGNPEERFREDKLRLLRAIRFASNLSFEIEPETFRTIQRLAPEIKGVSPERIREELVKIFTRAGAGRGLGLLSESRLLKEILPEVEAMKGVDQPREFHPEGDVFIHTKLMLDKLDHPSVTLAFSCLLHDVGKPLTYEVTDRIRFNQHPEVGAELSEKILARLRFSNEEKERIIACVQNHMRFKEVQKMRPGKLKGLLQRETFLEELELHRIDCLSSHGILENWEFLRKKLGEFSEEDIKPKPFLRGDDLLTLGFTQGPLLGKILTELNDLQLEGTVASKEEALAWVLTHYPTPS